MTAIKCKWVLVLSDGLHPLFEKRPSSLGVRVHWWGRVLSGTGEVMIHEKQLEEQIPELSPSTNNPLRWCVYMFFINRYHVMPNWTIITSRYEWITLSLQLIYIGCTNVISLVLFDDIFLAIIKLSVLLSVVAFGLLFFRYYSAL